VRQLAFEASRRAEAMGLVEPSDTPGENLQAIRQMARHVGRAGIATATAAALNNVEPAAPQEVAALLETLIAALEASPAPKFEWTGLARVLDQEALASLLNVSLSSLKRYQSGERTTPDPVAARLHLLALIVGDLAGSYNDIGIRRWFRRKRTVLDGRSPADLLRGEWDPDEAGPTRVRKLARELVTLSAT
jgi:transcriptional regulator with XRE-family HTH domain